MEFSLETSTYFLLFFIAFLAANIDSIAGGGGLLTTPAMLLVGINPLNTLATNKFPSLVKHPFRPWFFEPAINDLYIFYYLLVDQ